MVPSHTALLLQSGEVTLTLSFSRGIGKAKEDIGQDQRLTDFADKAGKTPTGKTWRPGKI